MQIIPTYVSRGTFANGEDGAQIFLLFGHSFLQTLQLPQALATLVLHGAHVLDKVQLGLRRVVT